MLLFQYQLKKEPDNGKTITYKLKLIDSFRLMPASLSSLVDNLSEFYKKNAKDAWKEEKSDHNAFLLSLKIINYVTNAKNVK